MSWPSATQAPHTSYPQRFHSQAFREKLWAMALPLSPLVQLTTGLVHPDFPLTMLAFWLLNGDQLDDLARFYHQAELSVWTLRYPCPVAWRYAAPAHEKRRKFGRFIGLRGCESADPHEDDVVLQQAREARYREEEDDVVLRKIHGVM
jgi:hypothetical protein